MNRLAKLIKELDIDDLQLIKQDLEAGNIDRVIKQQLKVKEANKISLCPVCSVPVKEGSGIHIQFGPETFRKKATFDGVDCLIYFVENNLKKK